MDRQYRGVIPVLAVVLVVVTLASIRWGAVPISLQEMWSALGKLSGDRSAVTLN